VILFHPGIIALFISSILICGLVLYAAFFGAAILRHWDLNSGSERQLELERKTYLISTILAYVFAFQITSLFLYVYTADTLHALFTGAMCAAGTLNVNGYGYPTLVFKILNFILAGIWLILNHADNQAYDYPLIKKKYMFLIFFTPLLLTEGLLQAQFLLNLAPDVITSCCGTLFSTAGSDIRSDLASMQALPMMMVFYASIISTLSAGVYFYYKQKGGYLFAFFSACTFLISIASIISFISVYIYELPTHHCPFCILQKDYGFIGYAFYAALFGSTVAGIGVGVLMPCRKIRSMYQPVQRIQSGLALASIVFLAVFVGIVTVKIIGSNLNLLN
jgi:hypothetical protein